METEEEKPEIDESSELEAIDAASARLRELHEEKHERSTSKRTLWIGVVVAVLFGALIYNLPPLLMGETMGERLKERALAYCKYDGPPNCERRLAHRADVCLGRERGSDPVVFGNCMREEFDDYYTRIADNLPKK